MDLCGNKIVGVPMDGCILHSDTGSHYCSLDYQALAKEHGFISSMSRKGNGWDNAPTESFWGKLKQKWLNGLVDNIISPSSFWYTLSIGTFSQSLFPVIHLSACSFDSKESHFHHNINCYVYI